MNKVIVAGMCLAAFLTGAGLVRAGEAPTAHDRMEQAVHDAERHTLDLEAQGLQGGCWPEFNLDQPDGYEIICRTAP